MRAPFVDSERDCSAAHLAMQLRKQGYITQLRNAKPRECGKACGRTCLEKLQHTYILVIGSLDSAVTVRTQQFCPDTAQPASVCQALPHTAPCTCDAGSSCNPGSYLLAGPVSADLLARTCSSPLVSEN